ncbi:metal ABC transporter ATP-binding protein [Mycolicibacterium palauense]|uniref:metal ABC transporter ATP-binding protein n=1 Tax=Mycolicibacterium palauense TaxID=2034511 RepID=UPI000BFED142|nr:metal ABC transporter ATP-binding protein [Mycolicibacterium palauense]
MTDAPACRVRNLSVAYGDRLVVDNASFEVDQGAIMAVVGPNGAGKSTLIKAAMGLLPASTGEVEFFGHPVGAVRDRIAYMSQFSQVDWDFPISVKHVVAQGVYPRLGWFKRFAAAQESIVERSLDAVGLPDLAKRQIGELSGGQRKRVFLARALAQRPDLYLLDEPYAGVDVVSARAIDTVLADLARGGATVVLVHHELSTVRNVCSHVTLINESIVASGTVDDAFVPENLNATYGLPVT